MGGKLGIRVHSSQTIVYAPPPIFSIPMSVVRLAALGFLTDMAALSWQSFSLTLPNFYFHNILSHIAGWSVLPPSEMV